MPAKRRDARVRKPARSSNPPRSRLIALLIVGPLLSVLALTGLAYLGLTQQAQRDALAQVGIAAQAAHGNLQTNVGALQVANGQLASALPANVTKLNNNNAEAQTLRAQVGIDIVIAQREQNGFVVVASSLAPTRAGAAAGGLGERLSGAVASNACSTSAHVNTGSLTLGGVSYLAGSAPLVDGAGACIGAVVTLTPTSALRQTPLEYTVILAMAGALLALITVVAGLILSSRESANTLAQNEHARAAVLALTNAQTASVAQLEQREWINRRLATAQQRMRHVMATLATDRVALQETATDIWAGVSHPGAPVDPAIAMRLAREGAVVASRIGSRLNDIDAMTESLFADLETAHEINGMLDTTLARSDQAIGELCDLTGVAPAQPHAAGQSGRVRAVADPFSTSRMEAQRQATRLTPNVAPGTAVRQTGGYRAVRPETAQHRAMRPHTGQYPSVGDRGATGNTPAPGQSQYGRRPGGMGGPGGQSGQRRTPSQLSSSGRHPGYPGHPGQQPPRQPRPGASYDTPQDGYGRDRDASGSRWLND